MWKTAKYPALLVLCLLLLIVAGCFPSSQISIAPVGAAEQINTPTIVSTSSASEAPAAAPAAAGYDWPQFNFDPQHSGNNTEEAVLGASNVASLQLLFRVKLPAVADGSPAYLSGVSTSEGVKDLLFMTTKDGRILAVDAHSGAIVWSHQYGPNGCLVNNNLDRNEACYTTSSPAIDPNRQYVFSYGLDGKVHKYQVGNGNEITTGGWPAIATLKGWNEKGSSALSIATAKNGKSYLYVANGGYPGDQGDYQGHITAIDLATGAWHIFNALCSDAPVHFEQSPASPDCPAVQSAIWARAGVVYNPGNDRIYMATGNGNFDPNNHDWGDTVFSLNPDGTGAGGNPLDTYTPTNFQQLDDADADLGSTAPAILPTLTGSSVAYVAVQGGKDGLLRLLNLENLSGQGGTGHTGGEIGSAVDAPGKTGVLTQPAVWKNPSNGNVWVFVANGSGIAGYKAAVSAGKPTLAQQWSRPQGGTSPILANGVIYYAGGSTIYALDPLNGQMLWSATLGGGIHWESPIVANGMLYITDEGGNLSAFALILLNEHAYLPAISR